MDRRKEKSKMILMIIPNSIGPGVISSQTLPIANYFGKKKTVNILIDERSFSRLKGPFPKNINFIFTSESKKSKTCLKEAEWIYIRDIYSFVRYYFKKKYTGNHYKIFYDFRGLLHEESFFKKENYLKKEFFFHLEKYVSIKADALGVVSYNLKDTIERIFKTTKPIYITPCCISKINSKPKLDSSKINFVYIGGLSPWQRFERIIEVYRDISQKIKNTSLTIITGEPQKATMILKEKNLNGVIVKSLTHEEVIKELQYYDFGFLLRHNVLMNNVASPIKFLEYISNGVIPILSEGIGDYSELVKTNEIGIILKEEEFLTKEEISHYHHNKKIFSKLERISKTFLWKEYLPHHPLNQG